MFGLPLPLIVLSFGFAIGLCFHAVKTGQDTFWLWIILAFQPLGGLAYLFVIVVPGLLRGTAVRKVRQGARETLDPHREYREAAAALAETPTVHNRMRLATAAMERGLYGEAEQLYREASQGVHADDPALRLGRAKALIELGRPGEALPLLQALKAQDEGTPAVVLALARAYQGLSQPHEAEAAFREATERMPGLEAIARYAAFLGQVGRSAEARDLLAEIDRRVERARGPFHREAKAWRDLAAAGGR